jgi:hypothetical protein
MSLYTIIPRDQISKEEWASYKSSYSSEAYSLDIVSFIEVKEPLSGLKDVPKSVIRNIS